MNLSIFSQLLPQTGPHALSLRIYENTLVRELFNLPPQPTHFLFFFLFVFFVETSPSLLRHFSPRERARNTSWSGLGLGFVFLSGGEEAPIRRSRAIARRIRFDSHVLPLSLYPIIAVDLMVFEFFGRLFCYIANLVISRSK